ncbi:hypothetical protein [Brevundimonas sp.]|uniref:hypothetical protein n=1 Tax=Brevundimonas sp. TaxID=1871086 RepID=UPI003566BDA3
MNKLAGLVTLCVILAIIRAALIALVVALLLVLLVLFITRPKDTLILLGAFVVMGLANARPLAFIAAVAIIGVAVVVLRLRRRRSQPLRLHDGR